MNILSTGRRRRLLSWEVVPALSVWFLYLTRIDFVVSVFERLVEII